MNADGPHRVLSSLRLHTPRKIVITVSRRSPASTRRDTPFGDTDPRVNLTHHRHPPSSPRTPRRITHRRRRKDPPRPRSAHSKNPTRAHPSHPSSARFGRVATSSRARIQHHDAHPFVSFRFVVVIRTMFAREGGFSSSRRVKADASRATTETSGPGDFLPVGWVFKSVRRVLDFGLRERERVDLILHYRHAIFPPAFRGGPLSLLRDVDRVCACIILKHTHTPSVTI